MKIESNRGPMIIRPDRWSAPELRDDIALLIERVPDIFAAFVSDGCGMFEMIVNITTWENIHPDFERAMKMVRARSILSSISRENFAMTIERILRSTGMNEDIELIEAIEGMKGAVSARIIFKLNPEICITFDPTDQNVYVTTPGEQHACVETYRMLEPVFGDFSETRNGAICRTIGWELFWNTFVQEMWGAIEAQRDQATRNAVSVGELTVPLVKKWAKKNSIEGTVTVKDDVVFIKGSIIAFNINPSETRVILPYQDDMLYDKAISDYGSLFGNPAKRRRKARKPRVIVFPNFNLAKLKVAAAKK